MHRRLFVVVVPTAAGRASGRVARRAVVGKDGRALVGLVVEVRGARAPDGRVARAEAVPLPERTRRSCCRAAVLSASVQPRDEEVVAATVPGATEPEEDGDERDEEGDAADHTTCDSACVVRVGGCC